MCNRRRQARARSRAMISALYFNRLFFHEIDHSQHRAAMTRRASRARSCGMSCRDVTHADDHACDDDRMQGATPAGFPVADAHAGAQPHKKKFVRHGREQKKMSASVMRATKIAQPKPTVIRSERAQTPSIRRPTSVSADHSQPAGWPCRRSVSSPDRRTSRAWSASPSPVRPCPDWRR